MKYLVALALLFPLSIFAQDCPIRKEIDAFSQKPKLTTGFIKLGGKVSVSIDATATDIDFLINFTDKEKPLCFDETSMAAVFFDSSRSRSSFRNGGATNCEGIFHITFRNSATTPSGLNRMSTTRIASFKITGKDDKPIEIILSEPEKEKLMKMISCIASEAKTLRP
jgi:hypothetical protein